ncbi:MAG: hypothetical protein ACREIS_06920 [Nitrospiraceae bacterium]
MTKLKPLTHDEQVAAEAAFRGHPLNPAWSAAAQRVYEGFSAAMVKRLVQDEMAPVAPRDQEREHEVVLVGEE